MTAKDRPWSSRRALGAAALAVAAWAALAGCSPRGGRDLPERPGIVLVIGDDVGFGDFGFMGSAVARTPHLDALAAEGVVFTHAFAPASVCRPSLRALLTGLQPHAIEERLRREPRAARGGAALADRFATLPEILVARGYTAFQGGKFWEGSPLAAGFTHAMGEFAPWRDRELPYLMRSAGGHSLALGRETLEPLFEFLDAHGESPFFVWYAPMLPHLPFDAPARYAEPYRDLPLQPGALGYYANLTRFDDTVGEILGHLQRRGLRGRTVLIYVADNGWDASTPPGDLARVWAGGRAGKLSIREAGFRTPVIVSWPGVLPGGRRDDRLVSTLDLFATILDLAGADAVPGTDGRSLLPLLAGGGDASREHVVGGGAGLLEEGVAPDERAGPRQRAWFLRTREWRYVFAGREGHESLYRIEEDPGEAHDLAGAYPEVLARLRTALLAEIDAMERPPAAAED